MQENIGAVIYVEPDEALSFHHRKETIQDGGQPLVLLNYRRK